ncbi:undecaprenyl-diphosphatase [Panacagrimonas perspica]|uniref:undecaprenyl-diphosphate phosphatase n=1 Tax=Panacagrimonas perspica TaxID=381431 RepID=A0A4R7PES7_9GAMM|nr:phosphatase PAP2 family protein [Panacagrimonas perspica]TDU32302.1 undecaprenyl-diphosphatase [Panacagrimonas perspica]THD05245.1 hypothetical protein B1810_00355 [Panacagrimonas perspica]
MDSLPRLIALHPVEVFLVFALVAVTTAVSVWLLLRRLREPLWNVLRTTWQRATGRWVPLSRLRTPAAWQGGPLLLDLLLGFVVVLAAVALFFGIADEIGLDEGLGRFDVALAAELSRALSRQTLTFFATVTHLGDAIVQWGLGVVVALVLIVRGRRLLAASWLVAVAGNGVMNRVLKALFERTRPLHEHGLTLEHGWSFPSGHTSGAVVIYGMLAYLGMRAAPPAWHLPITLSALLVVLLVGYSRIVLQVHYLSDVLAALVSGGTWLMVCITAARVVRVHQEYRPGAA